VRNIEAVFLQDTHFWIACMAKHFKSPTYLPTAVNWVHRSLHGSVQVVSNCLGALQRVTYLPPTAYPPDVNTPISLKTYWSNVEI
jgi:hypothetical protein